MGPDTGKALQEAQALDGNRAIEGDSMRPDISSFRGLCTPEAVAARRDFVARSKKRNEVIENTLLPVSQCLAEALEMKDELLEKLADLDRKIVDLRGNQ